MIKENKPVPHVHAEMIKAWADGEKIQWSDDGNNWREAPVPSWAQQNYYRVKLEPPKVIELYAHAEFIPGTDISGGVPTNYLLGNFSTKFISTDNLKLSFCPTTRKLIAAELVKHTYHEKADWNE